MIPDTEHVEDLAITLSEPWVVHRIPNGIIHAMTKFYRLQDGTLLMYYNIVGDYVGGRRVLRSTDGGLTWAHEPVRLEAPQGLAQFPDGSVMEFENYSRQVEEGVFEIAVCRSLDGGHTWQSPESARFYLPTCHMMYTAALTCVDLGGEVISVIEDARSTQNVCAIRLLCVVTRDMGRTWHLRAIVESPREMQTLGLNEHSIARLADGSLLAVSRSEAYESHRQMRSFDGGHTWTQPERITGWGCFPHLEQLANGVLALSSGRPGYTMQFSLDGRGELWTHHTEIAIGLGGWNNWFHEVAPNELLLSYDMQTRAQGDDPGSSTLYMRRMTVQRVQGPPRRIVTRDGREMVYIPAGMFHYGADHHQVCTGAYYIDRYPVTIGEYERFAQETGYRQPLLNHGLEASQLNQRAAVVAVSWDDAAAYARWAGKRLPTDMEWEKAARGVDGRIYPWGDTFDPQLCYCLDSPLPHPGAATYPGGHGAVEVGLYSPQGDSPFGVADMAGNVGEWTATEDPHWPGRKIWKGGSFNLGPEMQRCSWYRSEHPDNRHTIGIRCVLDAGQVT